MKISFEFNLDKKEKVKKERKKIFRLSSYFSRLSSYFSRLLELIIRKISGKIIQSLIIIVTFIVLFFIGGFIPAFSISYLLIFLLFSLGGRVSMITGLVIILVCPFLIIFGKETVANGLAIWAYYFLIIGVVLQFAEYIKYLISESVTEKTDQLDHKEDIFSSQTEQKIQIPVGSQWKRVITITVFFIFIFAIIGFTQRDRISRLIWGESKTEEVVTEQEEEELEEVTEQTIDKASISIQILNGNGDEDSVLQIKDELEDGGFKVESTDQAENYDYIQTVIFYKLGKKDEAELARDAISKNESIVLKQVISGQDSDIVIIVGADQLSEEGETVDRSNLRIMVQNGSGYEGAASRMRDKLDIIGYTYENIDIGDADNPDYENSIVYYRTDYKKQAEQIASDIGGTAIQISEDPSLGDMYDIIIIVGLSEGT